MISFIKLIEQTRSTKNRVLDYEDIIFQKHAGKQTSHTLKKILHNILHVGSLQ
jgi:hypothetical protein